MGTCIINKCKTLFRERIWYLAVSKKWVYPCLFTWLWVQLVCFEKSQRLNDHNFSLFDLLSVWPTLIDKWNDMSQPEPSDKSLILIGGFDLLFGSTGRSVDLLHWDPSMSSPALLRVVVDHSIGTHLRIGSWWFQGCISCGILVSGIRARGVSSEHMENMEMFSCSPT